MRVLSEIKPDFQNSNAWNLLYQKRFFSGSWTGNKRDVRGFKSNFMENFSFPVIILKVLQIQTGLEKWKGNFKMSYLPLGMVLLYPLNVQLIYFVCCLLIALCGINRKMGFWGILFFSIIFSPILGTIVLLVSGKKRPREKLKASKT